MTSSSIEERMARLEGAYEQINHRLDRLEQRLDTAVVEVRGDLRDLRTGQEQRLDTGLAEVRGELHNGLAELRTGQEQLRRDVLAGQEELRRDMRTQFYWVLGLLFTVWLTSIVAIVLRT